MKKKSTLRDYIYLFGHRIGSLSLNGNKASFPLVKDPFHGDVAVATIAVGEKYCHWALIMIESLRSTGGFQGPLYVFTDEPAVFNTLENVFTVQLPPLVAAMSIKSYKTRLPYFIPLPYILYVDADVTIGRNISNWLREAKENAHKFPVVLFWDYHTLCPAFHAGIVMLNAERSLPVLKRWRFKMLVGRNSRDQVGLFKSIRVRDVYAMGPDALVFPSKEEYVYNPRGIFHHFTNHGRLEEYPKILDLLHQLGVSEEQSRFIREQLPDNSLQQRTKNQELRTKN
jgi:hypothetical protein